MKLNFRQNLVWTSLVIVFCLSATLCTAEDERRSGRWAIVANLSQKNLKYVDLLTAKLVTEGGFQLVERADAEAAIREADLKALSDAPRAADRAKIGSRLGADVLLMLDEREVAAQNPPTQDGRETANAREVAGKAQAAIRIVVCDVRSGARVLVDGVSIADRTTDQVVDRIAEIAAQTRTRLSKPLRYVVSVSPFLSKDLKHDFDWYQSAFAQLLEASFSVFPGVAVVEREEARAIWNEVADRANPTPSRAVPLMVDGEYRTTASTDRTHEPTIDLTVNWHLSGSEVRKLHSGNMAVSEVPGWVASLPEKLAQLREQDAKPAPAFNVDDQFKRLVERAEAFAKLGDWYHVQGLREAALLLKPMDAENRINLFNNHQLLLNSVGSGQPAWLPVAADARLEKLLSIYRDGLANAEFLMRNKLVHKGQAVHIIGWRPYRHYRASFSSDSDPANLKLEETEQVRKDFLWRIAPLAFELPDDPKSRDDLHRRGKRIDLQDAILSQAVRPFDRNKPNAGDIDFLCTLWETRIPDELDFVGVVASIRYGFFPDSSQFVKSQQRASRSDGAAVISKAQWESFLERLVNSDRNIIRLTGKVERTIWHWYCVDRNTLPAQIAALKLEADDLAKEMSSFELRTPRGRTTSFGGGEVPTLFAKLRWQIERASYSFDPFSPRRRLEATKAKPAPRVIPANAAQPYESGRISLKRLPFAIPVGYAYSPPVSTLISMRYQGPRWTAWGTDIDLVWSSKEIWWMKEAGQLARLEFSAKPDRVIEDVQPSGNLLWIAVRNEGVWIIDRSGKTISQIFEANGLPPSGNALHVYPLSEKRAVAVGSFGGDCRAWCATIDIDGEKPEIRVFHEAKEILARAGTDVGKSRDISKMPEVTFIPVAVIPHTTEDGKQVLYVSRDRIGSVISGADALVIDLSSLTVSIARMPAHTNTQCGDEADCFMSHKGRLFHSSVPEPINAVAGPPRFSAKGQTFVKTKDRTYLPTRSGWGEFDPEASTYRNLCDPAAPLHRLGLMRFAASAHYGIVGWDYDPMRRQEHPMVFQVRIADAKPETAEQIEKRIANAAPRTVKPPPDNTKNFALSDEQKREMLNKIETLLAEEPKVSDKPFVVFSDGIAHLDGWLPQLQPQSCYLDPPEEAGGMKWTFERGELVRVETLSTERLRENYTIWHGSAGEPALVRQTAMVEKPVVSRAKKGVPKKEPEAASPAAKERAEQELQQNLRSTYHFGTYDDRGVLSRVVFLNANLIVERIEGFEVAGNYDAVKKHTCDSSGRVTRTIEYQRLDEKGQKVDFNESSKGVYSFHQEEIMAPTRAGLKPYYPAPRLTSPQK